MHRKAITLVEVMIVVVVLAIIGLIVVPQFSKPKDAVSFINADNTTTVPVVDDYIVVQIKNCNVPHKLVAGTYKVVSNSDKILVLQSTSLERISMDSSKMSIECTASVIEHHGKLNSSYKTIDAQYSRDVQKHTNNQPKP
ncbi:MAG TPA: prepilin-type N-terminal cleavage/methylation domain-containing protein [Candidatus Nanoarchaeia archaeon]|nr:prepilin-type N-terminal cleavage/methylation domain-containing protein [Candidatus Nanoarchaeia archaeon]